MADDTLAQQIETAAQSPAAAHDEAGGFTARPLADLIAADAHLQARKATRSRSGMAGIQLRRMAAGGAE